MLQAYEVPKVEAGGTENTECTVAVNSGIRFPLLSKL